MKGYSSSHLIHEEIMAHKVYISEEVIINLRETEIQVHKNDKNLRIECIFVSYSFYIIKTTAKIIVIILSL